MSSKKGTPKSSKKTTGKASEGFTAEEQAAMRERAKELKAEARANKKKSPLTMEPRREPDPIG